MTSTENEFEAVDAYVAALEDASGMPELVAARRADGPATPPSVGYAVTQMIHSGMLDDCLHLIEGASRARRAILARDRFNRPIKERPRV